MGEKRQTVFKKAVIVNDEYGLPNHMTMYYMEPGTYEPEDVPDMFKVNGKTVAAVLISQYTNAIINRVPVSMPYQKPVENKNYEDAAELCRRKGKGWHMMTNAEFVFLLEEAARLGHTIGGNNSCGKNGGYCYDGYSALTGTEPLAWSHDGTKDGVFGLCGNFWEWVLGLRLRNGIIEYIKDNDAAERVHGPEDTEWKAAEVDGKVLKLSGGRGVTLTTGEVESDWDGCHYSELELEGLEEVPEILHRLGVVPGNWKNETAGLWADSSLKEAVPIRGSSFDNPSFGGAAALFLNDPRSFSGHSISFRSALYLEDWKQVTELL